MNNTQPKFDLEERTFQFAKLVSLLCRQIKIQLINEEIVRQLVRSSASVGANYIEANDALGKKDFVMRIKISRKEAKETAYWLKLLSETNQDLGDEISKLHQEAIELKKIFSAIIIKAT